MKTLLQNLRYIPQYYAKDTNLGLCTPKIYKGKHRKYSSDNMTLYVSKLKLKYFKCKVHAMQIMCLIDIIIKYRRNLCDYFQYMQKYQFQGLCT
jgi:hypothetical protein